MTGAGGFVGSWLVPRLEAAGHPTALVLKPGLSVPKFGRDWIECDLRVRDDTRALVRDAAPDWIVHLAAVAFPPEAGEDPLEALRMNYSAVDHLLGAVAAYAPGARLLHVSTGAVYAPRAPEQPPAREEETPIPGSLYAATKAAAEARVRLAVERERVDAVCARPFNHSGPGRPPQYAESSFAQQLAQIERGEREPVLRVGNLDTVRDFSDVRDVVRAYLVLLESGVRGGTYNVCSGRGWSLRAVLDHLIEHSRAKPRVERDAARYRAQPRDQLALVGDPTRIRALGWTPEHAFEKTLDALLDSWRDR